jgi:putative restriction endonuclease
MSGSQERRARPVKGVFDAKPNSAYDDDITRRYHFPATPKYMAAARAVVGDWIIYYEPQRNRGRRAYIAVAKVLRIEPDPDKRDHAYAIIDPATYLPFDRPVPFSGDGAYWEAPWRAVGDPKQVGRSVQGKSLRLLDDADFAAIVQAGLSQTLAPENAIRLGLGGMSDVEQAVFEVSGVPGAEQTRRIERMLVNRKIRDANFRRQVCEAYDDRCAVTGLQIINGGGRSEVQAAHIRGVGEGGPDVVQNGLALSGTVHWLFDRHLISVTDDYRLLVAHNRVPRELLGLFEKQMDRIDLPKDARLRPHPEYLAWHRERYSAAA